ncbi:MAG TPA: ATP-binding protein [Acidimicrobiales bacterium]|nr:ATP-binding protein [Acidimicrobiales bacterium]
MATEPHRPSGAGDTAGASLHDAGRIFDDRYQVVRSLKRGRGTETLLGTDLTEGGDVVIKTIAVTSGAGPDVSHAGLGHEAAALRRLRSPASARLLHAGRHGDLVYLVMPRVRGITLQELLSRRVPPVQQALVVGRALFEALEEAHDLGVLHGDVKPANVMVDERDGELCGAVLIDFGSAHFLRVSPSREEARMGTARYASPEAAGLLAHEPDARSDLYSAGVVLFECLAGRPPFTGDTVGDVLRAHLNRPAPSLRSLEVDVPRALDEIVQRLLRKDPADRYASAGAVRADLDELAAALERGEADPSLVIGGRDVRRTLTEPAFVGRTHELAVLEDELEQLHAGHGRLVLVEGASGGGKSRLLEELARRAEERGTWVVRGQGIDQAALRPFQVLDGVVDELTAGGRNDGRLAGELATCLGRRRQAVCDALPQLADLLGARSVGSLGPEAYGEARSLPALAALLDALGSVAGPTLVLLDDCQWADELTLKLLGYWSTQHRDEAARAPVMVVAAFRTEEVPRDHLLRGLLPSTHLALAAFGPDDVRRLLTSMAGELPEPAVDVVERLSEGNAFMATAVLRGLVESGALVGTPSGWRVQADAMADVKTSRHAAAFLARRLQLLPPEARRLLGVGAVLGKEFDLDMAVALAGETDAEAGRAAEEARRRQILWTEGRSCIFVHDKLREVLLEQLGDDERTELHRSAALAIRAQDPDRVFELAYHFDAAGASDLALPYALTASERARARNAVEVAERQYRIAERGAATADQVTRQRVAQGLGEVLMLRGRYGESARQLEQARALAEDEMARSQIDGKLGELAFKRGDVEEASEAIERGLRLLGRWVPRRRAAFVAAAAWEIAVQALHTLLPALFVGRRPLDDAEADLMAARLYSRLAYTYWFQRGRVPCLWAHLREMNILEHYPPTPELAQAYSEHAPVMTMVPYFSRGIAYAERSLAIRKDQGDLWGQGQSLHFYGVVLYSASRFGECIERCREAVDLLDRTGDRWEMNTADWHIAFSQYRLGDLRAAVENSRRVHEAGLQIGDHQAAAISLGAWSKASGGRVPAQLVHTELERLSEDVHTASEVLQAEGVRLIAERRPVDAAAVLQRAFDLVRQKGLKQEYVAPILPWLATALRLELEQTPTWSPVWKRRSRRARRTVRRARRTARSYKNNLPHALREDALLSAMRGRRRRARRLLDESLRVAEGQGARWEHAQSLLARGELGVHLAWDGAAADVEAGRRAASDLSSGFAEEPMPVRGDVTLSMLDRFDTLLAAGQKIASALSRPAVYTAVQEASLTLLRGERCTVLEVEDSSGSLQLRVVEGSGDDRYSRSLLERAVREDGPVTFEDALGADAGDSMLLSGARSALCAPISVRGQVVAALYVTHGQVGALFGEEERRLAEFIAVLAGSALENAEGFAQVETLSRSLEKRVADRTAELGEANRQLVQQAEVAALVRTVAVAANRASAVPEAMQVALDEICRYAGWPVGHLCLLADDRDGELLSTDVWHLDDPERFAALVRVTEGRRFAAGVGLPGRVLASGEPAWIEDLRDDANFPRRQADADLGLTGAFAFPLLAGRDVVGVLEFFSPDPVVADPPLLELMAQIGTELGRVIERNRAEAAIRASERELGVARDQAMEASRMKSQFLATMSHEIRTPMHGVVGFIDLLLETDLDPVQRDYAEGVRRAGEALMDLIDDILDFSKVESGKLELEEVEFDLEQLVEEVVQLAVEEAHGKGLEIVGLCHPDMPIMLRGDSGRLRQILLNLASNAVKFTEEGHVVVSADLAGSTDGKALVRLEVRDTGIGIPARERTRLFEPFSQGDASTTRHYGGTGLGLAISRQLAEAMGGEITLDSEPGRGSTFRVIIPLAPTSDPYGPRRAARGGLGGARVLVAGEGGMAGAALESQLAAWGMRPERADGASVCRRRIAEAAEVGAPFRLMFVDGDLADTSNPDGLRQLADEARAAGASVVLLSGGHLPDAASLGRLGAAACLPKPVRLSRLHDTVVRLLTPGPRPTASGSRQPVEPTATREGAEVLVVEDNDLNQAVVMRILRKLGYRADLVTTGPEAIDALGRKAYAAVLMDCHMPGMDGYQTTREIRRAEGTSRRTPIIALTASALAQDRERCLAAGMDDHVAKPFRIARLGEALSRWVAAPPADPGGDPARPPTPGR